MKNYYYMRFNIADAPEKIDCGSIVRMAKEVNEILGCEYERFGYHYDNPDNTNGSPCGKTFRKGKEEAFKKLLPRIHPGAIVLLHNTSSTNGSILDELLTRWEDMGYHFYSLEEFAAS